MHRLRGVWGLCCVVALGACDASSGGANSPLVIFAAGSLARPLGAAADSFAASTGITVSLEPAGSLDLARRVTELGQVPDVMALADEEVFPKLLMPQHVQWYARFARNRMVLARSANAASIHGSPAWWDPLLVPGVRTGRADPDIDPGGYRALMLFQLAERHYGQPGLAARLLGASPRGFVRPKSAELVALLQAGELDYAWMYESSARGARLPFDTLPPQVDLGSDGESATYALAIVRVAGARAGDSLEVRGAPIHYGVSIPAGATRGDVALRFLRYLWSADGQRILRREFLDVLPAPHVVGDGAPGLLP